MNPKTGIRLELQPDEIVWRFLVWSEARGEPVNGQLAVLWVVLNRALKSRKTMKEEILKPWQFSAFNHNDPNRNKMLDAHRDDPIGWAKADAIVELFAKHLTNDPTQGATHYYNPVVVNPSWGRIHPEWKDHGSIGSHVFGRSA